MKLAETVFAGEIAGRSKERIIEELKRGIFEKGIYILALSDQESDLLDLIPVSTFLDEVYMKYHSIEDLKVVGIAADREEAMKVMEQIVVHVYNCTGTYKIKDYFSFE